MVGRNMGNAVIHLCPQLLKPQGRCRANDSAAGMSLAECFAASDVCQDDLECSKEVCRSILETVDGTAVQLGAWEDIATSLAKASVAKSCGVPLGQLRSMSAKSIAPQSGKGAWTLQTLHSHPRKDILCGELPVLVRTLRRVSPVEMDHYPVGPQQREEIPAGTAAAEGDQAKPWMLLRTFADSRFDACVLSDAVSLMKAFKGCP